MSKKTIALLTGFVILIGVGAYVLSAYFDPDAPRFDPVASGYGAPVVVGVIESDEITESSGLAASKCRDGLLWTHNDSADGPYIFAINERGQNLGVWKVAGARHDDWEDIATYRDAAGQCFLYIGEFGNRDKDGRVEVKIYRVKEPTVANASNMKRSNAIDTESVDVVTYRYPDMARDAESLIVHPLSGEIYVLTKERKGASVVFKIAAEFGSAAVITATRIGELSVPAVPNGYLTGATISPDGTRVTVCDYRAAYELILPASALTFDEIWKQTPVAIDLGSRRQGEAITYTADGSALLATSEKAKSPVSKLTRR